ncbi:unnamed protein product [Prorocentrum cordatum]|uniref:Ubiquitin-like domain-containing protein n=1 Tax=Prorocentrum cordatum TaxID=2364126 RepID=A0ABN9R088_9DINO|nr:unnamed protein product [Polarella glacialis]
MVEGDVMIAARSVFNGEVLAQVALQPTSTISQLREAIVSEVGTACMPSVILGGRVLLGDEVVADVGILESQEVGVVLTQWPRLLVGHEDGGVTAWNAGTGEYIERGGREVQRLKSRGGAVRAVALSRDGTLALCGLVGGCARLWSLESGACLRTFSRHAGGVAAVALSADAGVAATGGADGDARLWCSHTGRCTLGAPAAVAAQSVLRGHEGPVLCAALPAGPRLALTASNLRRQRQDLGRGLARVPERAGRPPRGRPVAGPRPRRGDAGHWQRRRHGEAVERALRRVPPDAGCPRQSRARPGGRPAPLIGERETDPR